MSLHAWFNLHKPDLKISRWQDGHFVTECLICGVRMEKRPERDWEVSKR